MSDYAHINIIQLNVTRKTKIWRIFSKIGSFELGVIKWFGRWRKYAFFPTPDTVYEEVCLRDIAAFVEEQTKAHKAHIKFKKHLEHASKIISKWPDWKKKAVGVTNV